MSPNTRKLPLFALTLATTALSLLALPGPAHADGEVLDRRVNVTLADSAPDQAFQGLATMIGLDAAVVEPGVSGKVTVRLQNVRMRTVLDAVCESIGCSWSVTGTPAKLHILPLSAKPSSKVLPLKEPIDLKVTGANVRELLQTFGQIIGVETEIDPQITGKVSLELNSTPFSQALDKACTAAGCEWKLDTDGKSPVLRFTARK